MKPQDLQTLALAALQPLRVSATDSAPSLAASVDRLGVIRASIAAMEAEAEKIRTDLEAAGLPHIDGHLYRATVTQCKGKTLTDWQTIAKRFKPSAQLIRAYTKTGEAHTRLNVTARPTH